MSKIGRPKVAKDKARGQFISTRVSSAEYKDIEAAIKRDGLKKTEWVRNSLLSSAKFGMLKPR